MRKKKYLLILSIFSKVTYREIEKISPLEENQMPYRVSAKLAEEQHNLQNRNYSMQALESLYRFFLGSIAGGLSLLK